MDTDVTAVISAIMNVITVPINLKLNIEGKKMLVYIEIKKSAMSSTFIFAT